MNKPKVWSTTKIDCPNMLGLKTNKLGIGELPKIATQSLASTKIDCPQPIGL